MGIHECYNSDTEAVVYHIIADPEPMTEEDVDSIFFPETDSLASDMTIHSNDVPDYFIFHNGRQYAAASGVARWFPLDNVRRYILRSVLSKSLFGANYVGPVREALAPLSNGRRKRHVLELGTKAGTWIQEMSSEFPGVHFRTIDVAPMIAHASRPNITFEVYDFPRGLILADSSQDAVFMNGVFEMVKDYRVLLREAYRVLRPGALLHISDFHPHLWDSEDTNIPARRTNPVGCRLFDLVRAHISELGMDPDIHEKLPHWLEPGSELWEKGELGFENIRLVTKTYPAYVHRGHSCGARLDPTIATFIDHLSIQSTRDTASVLIDGGMDRLDTEHLVEAMIEEIRRPECCAMLKVYSLYAIKSES